LQLLETEFGFGPPVAYGLIQRGRTSIAKFRDKSNDCTAEVYFDQAPSSAFRCRSEYLDTISAYTGITGQERRPDIMIKFSFESNQRILILEAKETSDPSYMRDSVYKVLAYLKDFSKIWLEHSSQSPKAILMFPADIKLRGAMNQEHDIWLATADQPGLLRTAISSAIFGCIPVKIEGVPSEKH
jgi:hypothetical protein